MNTLWIVVIGALNTNLAFNLHAKRIDRNVIPADPKRANRAQIYMDGADLMATSPNIRLTSTVLDVVSNPEARGGME
jgi:carbon starvation protein CstA